jgi:hypothetical protein
MRTFSGPHVLLPPKSHKMKIQRRNLLVLVLLVCIGAWFSLEWLARSYRQEPYSLVEEGLYVGGSVVEPPPGTTAVVNLCDRVDPYPVDACLWEPILDGGKAPDMDWLRKMVEFIDVSRRAGNTVYVHCNAGVSRSGFVVTAYLMYEHRWARDQALEFVQSKRPQIQPNPAFMQRLAEWEQALKDQDAAEGQ